MRSAVLLSLGLAAACMPPQYGSTPGGVATGEATTASFAGTYATNGGTIQLHASGAQVTGTVAGAGVSGQVQGTVQNGALYGTLTMADGSSGQLVAYVTADGLQVLLNGSEPILFTRTSGGSADAAAPVASPALPGSVPDARPGKPGKSVAGAEPSTRSTIPAPKARPADGAPYRDDMDGWEVRTPPAWKFGVRGNAVLFGSDTEGGLIIVAFNRGVSFDQMTAGASTVIAQLGATQVGAARTFKARGGRGLVVEMTGTLPDGQRAYARSLGVAGPRGVVTVTAITAPDKIDALRKRVDAIALSARFFTPRATPAMKHLAGTWWHYHGSDSGISSTYGGVSSSYERTIELCNDGTFYDSSNSNIYATTKNPTATGTDGWGNPYRGTEMTSTYDKQGAGNGRWSATGDDMTGRLRLQFHNGNVEERQYVFKKRGGGDIELDGRWYGYSQDKGGQCR